MVLENIRGVEFFLGNDNIVKHAELKMLCGSGNYIEGSMEWVIGRNNVVCNKTGMNNSESDDDDSNSQNADENLHGVDDPAKVCDTVVYAINSYVYQCRDLYGRGNVVAKCTNNFGSHNRIFECENNTGNDNSIWSCAINSGDNNKIRMTPLNEQGKNTQKLPMLDTESDMIGTVDGWWMKEMENCELTQNIAR